MIEYSVAKINNSSIETIKYLLDFMCKKNKINKKKQNYKIFFSNEKIFSKNNDVLFTSGLKKYLSFYGKIYLNKKDKISETIYLQNEIVTFDALKDNVLIILGGVNNSTTVQNQEDIVYFYIAPSIMLDLQEPDKWEDI
jgi:hypothetical protein